MDNACPLNPTECIVCGAAEPQSVPYSPGGVYPGAPLGKATANYYQCKTCHAEFAPHDERLLVDEEAYVLHLSVKHSYAPAFDYLVEGPYWDGKQSLKPDPDMRIPLPSDFPQLGLDRLRDWALSEARKRKQQPDAHK